MIRIAKLLKIEHWRDALSQGLFYIGEKEESSILDTQVASSLFSIYQITINLLHVFRLIIAKIHGRGIIQTLPQSL